MKAHIRRAVAFVAYRLISDVPGTAIYDYQERRYVHFEGSLSAREVMVFDKDRGCYVIGKPAGGKISLFHFADSSRLALEITGGSFRGFDYTSSRNFTGAVEGRLIRVFDYEDHAHYMFGF